MNVWRNRPEGELARTVEIVDEMHKVNRPFTPLLFGKVGCGRFGNDGFDVLAHRRHIAISLADKIVLEPRCKLLSNVMRQNTEIIVLIESAPKPQLDRNFLAVSPFE